MIEEERAFEPEIVVYCCHYCGYSAADAAGKQHIRYPPSITILEVPCTGKVDIIQILHALESGLDGVAVVGCLDGNCNFQIGNRRAKKRVEYVKRELEAIGVDPRRVAFYNISLIWGSRFAMLMRRFTAQISEIGPNPLKTLRRRNPDRLAVSLRAEKAERLFTGEQIGS